MVKERHCYIYDSDSYMRVLVEWTDHLQNADDTFVNFVSIAAKLYIFYIKINNSISKNFTTKPYWHQALPKTVAERVFGFIDVQNKPQLLITLTPLRGKVALHNYLFVKLRMRAGTIFVLH